MSGSLLRLPLTPPLRSLGLASITPRHRWLARPIALVAAHSRSAGAGGGCGAAMVVNTSIIWFRKVLASRFAPLCLEPRRLQHSCISLQTVPTGTAGSAPARQPGAAGGGGRRRPPLPHLYPRSLVPKIRQVRRWECTFLWPGNRALTLHPCACCSRGFFSGSVDGCCHGWPQADGWPRVQDWRESDSVPAGKLNRPGCQVGGVMARACLPPAMLALQETSGQASMQQLGTVAPCLTGCAATPPLHRRLVQLPCAWLSPVGTARPVGGGAAALVPGKRGAFERRLGHPVVLPSSAPCTIPCLPQAPSCQAAASLPGALQEWGVTRLCFEHDTEPYAKRRWAARSGRHCLGASVAVGCAVGCATARLPSANAVCLPCCQQTPFKVARARLPHLQGRCCAAAGRGGRGGGRGPRQPHTLRA